ncbi:MAG: glycosyltransferase family 4 protein [Sulfurimonas sp.]|jgi:glycosyltransferase involved in cell wall biosynthesis
MKNKKIVELCLAHGLGGLELSALACHNYFKSKTLSYIVVAPDTKLDNLIKDENKITIKRNKLLPFIPAIKLAKFIDEKGIDLIHFHWGKDIITAVLAKLLSKKKPRLLHSRHMNMTRFKDDMYHRWLYKNIDMLHSVSKQVKEQMQKYIPSSIRPPIESIYLGVKESLIDDKKLQGLKLKYNLKDEFIVGMVGRIEKEKGQYILIEAINELKNLNIKALIIGHTMDSHYLQKLKQSVEDLGLKEKIIFTGFTKDVNEHIKLCDAVVLATKKETFGLVIVEAMINKVCALATNNGGPIEIIDNGINGLLFERTSNDLALKLEYLYNNPLSKSSLAQEGYKKAKEEFDYDKQMQKLYNLIEKL